MLHAKLSLARRGPSTHEATIAKAKTFGLADDDIAQMLKRFVPLYRAKGEVNTDWDARFETWFDDEANKLGRTPPQADAPAKTTKFHVKADTPQCVGCRTPAEVLAPRLPGAETAV